MNVLSPLPKRTSRLKLYKVPLCMIFSFLLGCMFAFSIVPIDKTCRIENADIEYNIMKNSKLKNPELIILILSAPKNVERRNVARETWLPLKDRGQENIQDSKKFKVKHFFVIGNLGLNSNEHFNLNVEQIKYNDILLLPIQDTYQHLTLKVLKSFTWINEQFDFGLDFKYVLKCDDDSFVRVDNLIHEIQSIELLYLKSKLSSVIKISEENKSPYIQTNIQINNNETVKNLSIYWGYFDGRATIKKHGKWKEENWIACDRYIPYALGGGYILSKNLITYIAKNVDYLRMYNSEDVSIGLWLSTVTNILRIHDVRFDTEWASRGCQNFYLISHKLSAKNMRDMTSNLKQNNFLCTKEQFIRNFYRYNWSALPSQCCNIKKKITL
ncbi:hypothetical protein WA026_000719 [Henosepilachna vigintioctopunctata]|uniref:Hexosyltransferase n=1 Tax=Henosepilachna vigintioctopunctata TaxID=420089 RepID=A0AAW1V8V2_9CUCU